MVKAIFVGLVSIFWQTSTLYAKQACIPDMPVPHANNAVAAVTLHDQIHLFSFAGLKEGKTWKDTSKEAYMYVEGRADWERLPDLPVDLGRLAATAEAVGERIYYFGGYTVAEDGSEVSTPENFEYNPFERTYKRIADMPVPVDDAVSFVYQNRYIYMVSGWHNEGNVRDVQYYDTETNTWRKATDYPGSPVFGHAGGLVGNQFVIADGVAVVGKDENGRRQFDTVNEGWMGTIDQDDLSKIEYHRLPQLPGRGHYRMGGEGDVEGNRVLFVGGTPNAYNYNGIGYNGEPSEPKKHVFAWDFTKDNWVAYKDKLVSSMDHRGLLKWHDEWITIGGMGKGQRVSDDALGSLGHGLCSR
ncbi:MAG: Kelch repeat-containing protein [Kordiimonas sp.]